MNQVTNPLNFRALYHCSTREKIRDPTLPVNLYALCCSRSHPQQDCPEAERGRSNPFGKKNRMTVESGHFSTCTSPEARGWGSLFCRTLQIYVPIRQFFYNLIHPDYSAVTDVYVLMFLADTVDFIIIVFGFWAFGVGKGQHAAND